MYGQSCRVVGRGGVGPLRLESSVSRDLRSHVPQMWGSSGSSPLAYVSGPGLCVGGM